jgi:hypothetical protein
MAISSHCFSPWERLPAGRRGFALEPRQGEQLVEAPGPLAAAAGQGDGEVLGHRQLGKMPGTWNLR